MCKYLSGWWLALAMGAVLLTSVSARAQGAATKQELDALRGELQNVISLQNRAIADEQRARTELSQRTAGDIEGYGQAIAQLKADNGQLIKNMQKLVDEISRLQQDNAALRKDNAALIEQLKKSFAAVDAKLQDEAQARHAAVQSEAQTREAADQQTIKTVADLVARKLNSTAAAPPPPAPTADNTRGTYVVARGDTLASIASAFGTSVSKLRAANNLSSDTLFVGQKLRIPKD